MCMTTHANNQQSLSAPLDEEITAHVQRYRSQLLSASQFEALGDDIRSCVLAASPPSKVVAGQWLSILSAFLAHTAPNDGGLLEEQLTSAKVASFLSVRARAGESDHRIRTLQGVLNRMIRSQRGLASKVANIHRRPMGTNPLTSREFATLRAACILSGKVATRAFAAVFSTGLTGDALVGATISNQKGSSTLVLASGFEVPAVADVICLAEDGSVLRDGDWRELTSVASDCNIHLNAAIALQTFRHGALEEDGAICDLMVRYQLNEAALTAIARHLDPVNIGRDAHLVELLRNGGLPDRRIGSGPLTRRRVCGRTPSDTFPPADQQSAVGEGGVSMKKKPSRAEMMRLAAEFREAEATHPEVPAEIAGFIDGYMPVGADLVAWAEVGPVLREMMRRSGLRSPHAVKSNCTALGHYLIWRNQQGLSLEIAMCMDHDAIDRFFVALDGGFGDRTRNDYRSRLRRLAQILRPTAIAPAAAGTGYNEVRQGYSTVEEALIRRAALDQRRSIIKKRLCAIVGFSGGGGLDPGDIRGLRVEMVNVTDDGIIVEVPGERARTVVIRRVYEPLVLEAIEGLKPGALVIGRNPKVKSPVAGIIEEADLFDDLPTVDMRRLRTTWITWVLTQPIPLGAVMAASGLTSARTLVDMIKYIPAIDPTVLRDGSPS